MFHMLSWFDIQEGGDLAECHTLFSRYAEHMQALDLIVASDPIGVRCRDTILDADDERSQRYFQLMHFRDKAQSDAAVRYIESQEEPGRTIHRALYAELENLVFVCWEDSL